MIKIDLNYILLILQRYDILWAIVIFLISMIAAEILDIIVKKYFTSFTQKTKTKYDDELINKIRKPIFYGIIILGAIIAILSIDYLDIFRDYILKVAYVFGIFWISYIATRVVDILFRWYFGDVISQKKEVGVQYTGIFEKLISILIYIIAIIIILKHFNVEISPLIASLGIGGLAVALALQDTLTNFFSGFYLVSDKTVQVGDYIELEKNGKNGLKGYVEDISWRTTRIRTPDNLMVIVPNSKLAQSITVNYNAPDLRMKIFFPLGVSYDSDLEKVERITLQVAKDVLKKLNVAPKDFEPVIRYKEFGDPSINFDVTLAVEDYKDRFILKHEFVKALKKAYEKNNIKIPYAIKTIYLKKGK